MWNPVLTIRNSGKLWKLSFPSKQNLLFLKENKEIVENQNEVTVLTITFQKVYLRIKFQNPITSIWSERMSCPTLKSIMKYRGHPNITAIQDAYKGNYFSVPLKRSISFGKSKASTKRKQFIMMIFLSNCWKKWWILCRIHLHFLQ